ncbi:MAG: hypothetical protein ABW201_05970 [Candidatus Thiodiazotropha sp.]
MVEAKSFKIEVNRFSNTAKGIEVLEKSFVSRAKGIAGEGRMVVIDGRTDTPASQQAQASATTWRH